MWPGLCVCVYVCVESECECVLIVSVGVSVSCAAMHAVGQRAAMNGISVHLVCMDRYSVHHGPERGDEWNIGPYTLNTKPKPYAQP